MCDDNCNYWIDGNCHYDGQYGCAKDEEEWYRNRANRIYQMVMEQ